MATGDAPEGIESKALALAAGLPAPVAAGGLKAIGRLIGGLADYPAALLRRASQGVEDGTVGRSIVSNALATAAAERAVADPQLVDRTLDSLLGKELRKQRNKEKVAEHAVEALAEPPSQPDDTAEGQAPDDDWMNVFERYAEDASSERMQLLWGRLLAGEIRKHRTYSLATMRFLSEADQETVQLVQRISKYTIGGMMIFRKKGDVMPSVADIDDARAIGLISGGDGVSGLIWRVRCSPNAPGQIVGNTHVLRITPEVDWTLEVPIYSVTRIGSEVLALSPSDNEETILKLVAKEYSKQPVRTIHVGERHGKTQIRLNEPVWTKEAP